MLLIEIDPNSRLALLEIAVASVMAGSSGRG
jgi:hypothetical protein